MVHHRCFHDKTLSRSTTTENLCYMHFKYFIWNCSNIYETFLPLVALIFPVLASQSLSRDGSSLLSIQKWRNVIDERSEKQGRSLAWRYTPVWSNAYAFHERCCIILKSSIPSGKRELRFISETPWNGFDLRSCFFSSEYLTRYFFKVILFVSSHCVV